MLTVPGNVGPHLNATRAFELEGASAVACAPPILEDKRRPTELRECRFIEPSRAVCDTKVNDSFWSRARQMLAVYAVALEEAMCSTSLPRRGGAAI